LSGQIRKHFLSSGDALDRRRIEELFLEAAKGLALIMPDMIRSKQFIKTKLSADSLEEMYYNEITSLGYKTPTWTGTLLPGTVIDIHNEDGEFQSVIEYSLTVKAISATAKWVYAVAIAGDKTVHGTGDFLTADQEVCYIAPSTPPNETDAGLYINNGERFNLCGSANIVTTGGNQFIGVIVLSDAEFEINACSCTARRVLR
jgi:hypothetical protein